MPVALIAPTLSQRLLAAAARRYHAGRPPPDWNELAFTAHVRAQPTAINKAITDLAGQGLIEGLCTPSGWLLVRPTARGIARAGRAGRIDGDSTLAISAANEDPSDIRVFPSGSERVHAAADQLSCEIRTLSAYSRSGWQWTRTVVPPRIATWRAAMAQAWRMFTTFP